MELTSHIGEQTEEKEHKPVAKAQKHNNAKVDPEAPQANKPDNKDE